MELSRFCNPTSPPPCDQLSGSDIQKGCLSAREEEDKAIVSATLSYRQEINKQNKTSTLNESVVCPVGYVMSNFTG